MRPKPLYLSEGYKLKKSHIKAERARGLIKNLQNLTKFDEFMGEN